MSKKNVWVGLIVIAVILAVIAVRKCPYLGWMGERGTSSREEPPVAGGTSVKVDIERGELVREGDMWNMSYDVLSEGKLLFEGNIRSREVIAPYVQNALEGVVVIRYRGVRMPEKDKDGDKPAEASDENRSGRE
ncbi:MAG: hypothetical protein GF392_04455 [Candidatus Omnitrophica bacterium]|nr:hypothetical protein [Candidatus Omnitrophota bacterium]